MINGSLSVVIVPGWFTQSPMYLFLKNYLERKGVKVYITNFGLHLRNIDSYADLLASFINKKGLNDFVLVGASVGALISYKYLQKYQAWGNIHKFISIVGPFQGSHMAKFAAWFSTSAKQMVPNSSFMKELNSHHPDIEKTMLLEASWDEFVPKGSSTLQGVTPITLKCVGHTKSQAFCKEVYKIVLGAALENKE